MTTTTRQACPPCRLRPAPFPADLLATHRSRLTTVRRRFITGLKRCGAALAARELGLYLLLLTGTAGALLLFHLLR